LLARRAGRLGELLLLLLPLEQVDALTLVRQRLDHEGGGAGAPTSRLKPTEVAEGVVEWRGVQQRLVAEVRDEVGALLQGDGGCSWPRG
jgi:hypothetical protein